MKRASLIVVLIVASFFAGMVIAGRMRTSDSVDAEPAATRPPAVQVRAPSSTLPSFTAVAARAVPAVANISSQQVQRSPFADDPFFRHFFGGDPLGYRSQSIGSGVIVSADGFILTNNHVVGDYASSVQVVLDGGREQRAKLVGADPATDLALLKVEVGDELPTIPWGDSSKLSVAEWVLAIGNPYQLNQTVTLGIVSALGRSEANLTPYVDFIQTDAAINPGNSGGALVNERGELVGINTAIYSESGGYQGIGFAVPSNVARRITDELSRYGEVRRGYTGILQLSPVSQYPQLARKLRLPDTHGAIVTRIERGPASDAGIREGDVIRSVNGKPIKDGSELVRQLLDAPIGSKLRLAGVSLDGREFDVQVPVISTRRGQV
ncbi:MAG: trypsin-like serine protease [Luteitalea sp.]|nr:trypsin-like serine protease [Luteitalea sp.]